MCFLRSCCLSNRSRFVDTLAHTAFTESWREVVLLYLCLLTKKLNPQVKWIMLVTKLGKGRTRIESLFQVAYCPCLLFDDTLGIRYQEASPLPKSQCNMKRWKIEMEKWACWWLWGRRQNPRVLQETPAAPSLRNSEKLWHSHFHTHTITQTDL